MKKINLKLFSTIVIVIYALVLRFQTLASRELWNDEVYQFKSIIGPLKPFWLNTYPFVSGDHSAFPGEYLLNYSVAQWFGLNKWGLAIPHILVTIIGFYFLYKICQRMFQSSWGHVITFLIVSFNTNLVFHAFEFRPYATIPTLALGSLYFAQQIVDQYCEMTLLKKIGIGLFYFIAFNYHPYGILFFSLPVLFVVLTTRDYPRKEIFLKNFNQYFLVIFFISMVVWCWYASTNSFGFAQTIRWQAVHRPFEFIPNPTVNLLGFLKAIIGNLVGFKMSYILLPGLIGAFLIPHQEKFQQFAFLFLLIIIPIFLILLTDIKSNYWFVQRQFVWVMPFFAILLGWQWESIIVYIQSSKK